jgi:hypothetical protein
MQGRADCCPARSGGLRSSLNTFRNMPMSERRQCGSEVNSRSSADGQRITKNVTQMLTLQMSDRRQGGELDSNWSTPAVSVSPRASSFPAEDGDLRAWPKRVLPACPFSGSLAVNSGPSCHLLPSNPQVSISPAQCLDRCPIFQAGAQMRSSSAGRLRALQALVHKSLWENSVESHRGAPDDHVGVCPTRSVELPIPGPVARPGRLAGVPQTSAW